MSKTLFISDLHLSDGTEQIEQGLYRFLREEGEIKRLFLLGDIFEAWIGDDDPSDLALRFSQAMSAIAQQGTKIYFSRGNRDFLLGEAYLASFGGTLLGDEVCVTVAGEQTLLMHGDTLCTDDVDYLAFRSMVHNPAWQSEMLAKPLEERKALAQHMRAMSADASSNKPEDIMDVNAATVDKVMEKHAVKRLIHGHTHRPMRHTVSSGERVVLGDWNETGWCLRETESDVVLEEFSLF